MDSKNDIKTRTFGIEIEMCNLDRSKVSLPPGYSWSEDEEIVNTDGTCNKRFGGEVNTPPLRLCMGDLHGLRSVYESMVEAGGIIKWTTYTHVHIYAGDLTVEQMKKVFLFFYVCYPFVKKYTKLSDWDELTFNCQPLPIKKYYDGVLAAQSFEDLKTLFTNQSNKGYIRHAFNISAYFKTKTIEFRTYHGTNDFYMAMNCVFATYRMFYYAVNHSLEDFVGIETYGDFLKAIKLKYETPQELIPLIYQGNPYSAIETFYTKPIYFNGKLGTALLDSIKANDIHEIVIVNSFMFQYEMNLWKKVKVVSYNQDGYNHLLYKLSVGLVRIHYANKLEWMEKFNQDNPVRQVAMALYIFRLMQVMGRKNAYNNIMFDVYKDKAEESILKTESSAKRLIEMFTSIKYVNGNLHQAIKDEKNVFFSFGKYKKSRRALRVILENSDYENDAIETPNDYYELIERLPDGSRFFMFSNSPYLSNMNKLAFFRNAGEKRDGAGRFLYSNVNQEEKKAVMSYNVPETSIDICVPPDDLKITDPSKLDIVKISPQDFKLIRRRFVVKADKESKKCYFTYAIMYDKYILGGVGFEFFQGMDYDLWQLSDFCTNNNIPRLSKLILMCVLSVKMQKILSRRLIRKIKTVITYVYTKKPVSMKYRGIYAKCADYSTQNKLAYIGNMGEYQSMEEIVNKYNKYVQNAGK